MAGLAESEPSAPQPASGYRPGYEIAAERILEYIVGQELRPGARLPTETALAEIIGMSRTIVREAVKILSALGRLSVQRGRGIYVARPQEVPWAPSLSEFLPTDPDQVDEIFEFRRFVELSTTDLASRRATPAQVRAIREAADRTLELAEGDLAAFNEADSIFHRAIGEASANMFMVGCLDAVQRLQLQISVIGLASTAGGSITAAAQQHVAIAAAIAAGDTALAVRLMAAHIDITAQQFKGAILGRVFSSASEPAEH
ncbi:DNA-binding FadR family transcriptional regulator [Agromyces cerinus]|uniref:FadR/GntR family transcriptional regulator n=1 Tax=Agromyces cerinus TaxID=33878 RepID=UPI00195EB4E9|nr:FCD domain-containing protein [Agromyces cerinus]MBM7832098.1 DNA-binding FadR family transcriptional regulator [Agromyces cerinus]